MSINTNKDFDTIVLQVPKGTKSEWVRQSQIEGKKLNQWIFERMIAEANRPPKGMRND